MEQFVNQQREREREVAEEAKAARPLMSSREGRQRGEGLARVTSADLDMLDIWHAWAQQVERQMEALIIMGYLLGCDGSRRQG